MAREALANIEFTERDQSSIMMATSKKKLQEAKAMIKKFRLDLAAFLEDCPEKDSVYQMSVSLFPLTQGTDPKKNKTQETKKTKATQKIKVEQRNRSQS